MTSSIHHVTKDPVLILRYLRLLNYNSSSESFSSEGLTKSTLAAEGECVARSFSSEDLRVHLAGDAGHVHSVFGGFGLNASTLDVANLGWKIGLCARGKAGMHRLLPSYDRERRLHAADIIEVSGIYLRYSCNRWDLPVPRLYRNGEDFGDEVIERSVRGKGSGIQMPPGVNLPEHLFLPDFYMRFGAFLLGLDVAYGASMLNVKQEMKDGQRPVTVENGVRCPNARVCLSEGESGYLYDKMKGSALFHILVFASDVRGPVREGLKHFSASLSKGFYNRYGGRELFNILFVTKCLPFEIAERTTDTELRTLGDVATIVYDDRRPDEDAHFTWGIDHAKGAVVVVRPDLWVGMSAFPDETARLDHYFGIFLLPQSEATEAEKAPNAMPAARTEADTDVGEPTNGHLVDGSVPDSTANGTTTGEEAKEATTSGSLAPWLLPCSWGKGTKEAAVGGSEADSNARKEPMDELKDKVAMDAAHDGPAFEEAKIEIPVDEPGASTDGGKGEYFVPESASVNATH